MRLSSFKRASSDEVVADRRRLVEVTGD